MTSHSELVEKCTVKWVLNPPKLPVIIEQSHILDNYHHGVSFARHALHRACVAYQLLLNSAMSGIALTASPLSGGE